MKKRNLILVLAVVVVGVAWYAFRPERLFINQSVSEPFPAASATTSAASAPVALVSGQFHSVAHDGKGVATVFKTPDGKRVLRLTEFETSNGPELMLYLVAANDATDSEMVKKAGFVTLGPLKGNEGDQNYEVPAGTDLTKYRAVTVWCHRFGVNFATAPLAKS